MHWETTPANFKIQDAIQSIASMLAGRLGQAQGNESYQVWKILQHQNAFESKYWAAQLFALRGQTHTRRKAS